MPSGISSAVPALKERGCSRSVAHGHACPNPKCYNPPMKPALFLLLSTALLAQSPSEVEISAEPHHHLTLENQAVRVYNAEIPPHGETLMHWHRHDYIFVTLGASEISNAVKDKPPITLTLEDGETRHSEASFAHIARNLSDKPFRTVVIELLNDAALRNAPAKWDPKRDEDRALHILQGGTMEILFVKDNVRVCEFELQPGGIVPAHHFTTPHLLVAVSDLDLAEAHLHAGESKWFPATNTRPITNPSPKPAKFVTLEFP